MQPCEPNRPVLVITGMHRSGTSLTASLLQSAGLDLGERLEGPGRGNCKGHFEDLDFVEFHQAVLRSQGISSEGWTLAPSIRVQEQYVGQARELVRARHLTQSPWGWKDPRTTLFLDFWADMLPEARFVLVYRSPWEVVDSLYRRGDSIFLTNPSFALGVWLNYNRAILDFQARATNRCLLVGIHDLVANPKGFLAALAERYAMTLGPAPNVYEPALLYHPSSSHRPALIQQYFPEALNLWHELTNRSEALPFAPPPRAEDPVRFAPFAQWALEDWLTIRRIEAELESARTQVQGTK